jgi:Ca-activated chloride channel homolog
MTFASPELLLGLLLVPLAIAVYLAVQRRRSRYAVRFTNVDLLSNLVPRRPAWRRHVPPVLYLLAIAALVVGLARPSMVVAVPREEATVVLTLDVSRSMRATDVDPTRLAAAQQAASDFVDQLPERFKVGLVVFSTEARLVVEPTTDRERLHDALDALRADGGTALGDAIALSLEAAGLAPAPPEPAASPGASAPPEPAASPRASAPPTATPTPTPTPTPAPSGSGDPGSGEGAPVVATVLLSDGANSTGALEPVDAAEQAAALGVPIYTIALGTSEGVVDVPNDFGFLQPLSVPPDPETLAKVAEITGGRFFEAPTADDLKAIYENLGSKVGFVEEKQEVTQLFAAAGLAFVLAGAGLAAHWFNRFP